MKNLDQTSFPIRAVKTFSVATHLLRGIILFIGKSLRFGTSHYMKLSKWDYVSWRVSHQPFWPGVAHPTLVLPFPAASYVASYPIPLVVFTFGP